MNAFDMFDQDGNGYINIDDLKRACIEADFPLHDSELKEMIQEVNILVKKKRFFGKLKFKYNFQLF